MRNLTDTMICWNPGGDVALVHNALLGLEKYVDGLPDDMLPPDILAARREREAQ